MDILLQLVLWRYLADSFNHPQNVSDQVAAYMRDPSRMVKGMQQRRSAIAIFGTVSSGGFTWFDQLISSGYLAHGQCLHKTCHVFDLYCLCDCIAWQVLDSSSNTKEEVCLLLWIWFHFLYLVTKRGFNELIIHK